MGIQKLIGILALCALAASPALAEPTAPAVLPGATAVQRSEDDLVAGLMDKSKQRREVAATYVVEHPDSVNPPYLAYVSNILWDRGDRLQATFWFYIFQVRSRPWADQRDPAYTPARASLNAMLGPRINEWVGSDVDAWFDVAARAAAYERKIPLYAGRPEALSQSEWADAVQRRRNQNELDLKAVFGPMKADPKAVGKTRQSNGLYVGPLQNPGTPLPEVWS